MKKMVSVILPVYNCELYVAKAINSILSQTHDDFELIILNDGSSDRSHDIISGFKDSRIRYYKEPQNIGKVSIVNKGLTYINGDFIAMQDADDWSEPERLQKQVAAFEDPNLVVCFTGYNLIGHTKHGSVCRVDDTSLRKEFIDCGFLNHEEFIPTHCSTMMARKSVIDLVGGYSTFFLNRVCEDIHWISRIMKQGYAKTLAEPLYSYLFSRVGSFTYDANVNLNPTHLYGPQLAASVIQLENGNKQLRIEELSDYEKRVIELEACKKTLVEYHQTLTTQRKVYEHSTSYRIGKLVLSPWKVIQKLYRSH